MKVLLIEDDATLASAMRDVLEKDGFAVDVATTKEEGVFQAEEVPADCIVLDIFLPDGNGLTICERLRKAHNKTPILIVTACDSVEDRVKGLDMGADDYVTKPLDGRELLARVHALIRRNGKEPLPELSVGDLRIDPRARRAWRGATLLPFSSKEFAVLEFLAHHSDEVVSRTMMMEHIWGSDFETFSNVIDVYIRSLRKKIDTKGKKKLIHTVRGGGYSLSSTR